MINDRKIRVGHCPNPDDAFMFYDLSSGKVKLEGKIIEHLLEDIQFGERFVKMYVNELTIDMGKRSKKALEQLFKLSTERKLISPVQDILSF
jgi:predicted solute-binding protein